jgi:hypothetical protein
MKNKIMRLALSSLLFALAQPSRRRTQKKLRGLDT